MSPDPKNPKNPTILAIVGSRNFTPLSQVEAFVQSLPPDTVVLSGGARGVDSIAVAAAAKRGLSTLTIPAQWDRYGKSAGMKRNRLIVEKADAVVAFWDGTSSGTANTISLTREAGKPLTIFTQEVFTHEP